MTVSRLRTLVPTSWLRNQISALSAGSKPSTLRILDTSATPDPELDGYKEFYQESHIPQAAYFSLHTLCPASPSSLHKYPVPDSNRFQDYAESLGITNDTHIVTYDRSDTKFALKTWWLFRLFGHTNISVLDGGFRRWLMDGYEVTVEEPYLQRTSYQPAFNPGLFRTFEDMAANIKTSREQVIDARAETAFDEGHLPGSKNVPYSLLFNEDGTFRPTDELKEVFASAKINLQQPVAATCETAMTACGIAAISHILGKEDVPVYNGSFREWKEIAKPDQIEVD